MYFLITDISPEIKPLTPLLLEPLSDEVVSLSFDLKSALLRNQGEKYIFFIRVVYIYVKDFPTSVLHVYSSETVLTLT